VQRKLGGLKRRNKLLQHKEFWSSCASSNEGVLPQVWVTRTWTLDLTLHTGYPHNTGLASWRSVCVSSSTLQLLMIVQVQGGTFVSCWAGMSLWASTKGAGDQAKLECGSTL
jgi:hypothetical protein